MANKMKANPTGKGSDEEVKALVSQSCDSSIYGVKGGSLVTRKNHQKGTNLETSRSVLDTQE